MIEEQDLEWFTQAFLAEFGFDFTDYSRSSLARRIQRIITVWRLNDVQQLLEMIRLDPALATPFIQQVTVTFTTMFRDPDFFLELRRSVLPYLSTFPLIRLWIAGCATGEEAYSAAVLFKEYGLLERTLIYATDLNATAVERARKGVFPMESVPEYANNYLSAGGDKGLSKYYSANHGYIQFNEELRSRMVFSTHNLVSDASFNSFQLILCRNVLIYFNRSLQNKVISLFNESLENSGFIGLGSKETLAFSADTDHFQRWGTQKIWKKNG